MEIISESLFEPGGGDWRPLIDAVLETVTRLNFAVRAILCVLAGATCATPKASSRTSG